MVGAGLPMMPEQWGLTKTRPDLAVGTEKQRDARREGYGRRRPHRVREVTNKGVIGVYEALRSRVPRIDSPLSCRNYRAGKSVGQACQPAGGR